MASVWLLAMVLASFCYSAKAQTCPDEYNLFHFDEELTQPTCIKIRTEADFWLQQRQACVLEGGDLAITTEFLQTRIAVFLSRFTEYVGSYYMGGLEDGLVEEKWDWVNGEPMTEAVWENGHPQSNERDCAVLCPEDYLYCSEVCDLSLRAICQLESIAGSSSESTVSPPTTTTEPQTAASTTTEASTEQQTASSTEQQTVSSTELQTDFSTTTEASTEQQTSSSATTEASTEQPTTSSTTTQTSTISTEQPPTSSNTTTTETPNSSTTENNVSSDVFTSTNEPTTTSYVSTVTSTPTDVITTTQEIVVTTLEPYDITCPLLYSKWYFDEGENNPTCLRFIEDNQVWNTHRALCIDEGAKLLQGVTPHLARAIANYLPTIPTYNGRSFFVGSNDIEVENEWLWNDGSPINSEVWAPGQPNGGTLENCGSVCSISYLMCDIRCNGEAYAICQAPGTLITSTANFA